MIEEETGGPAQASSCICAGAHTTRAIAQILMAFLGLHHGLCTVVVRSVFLLLHPNTHPVKHVQLLLHLGTLTQDPSSPGGYTAELAFGPKAGLPSRGCYRYALSPALGILASFFFSCVLLGSLLDPPELQFSLLRGSSELWGG